MAAHIAVPRAGSETQPAALQRSIHVRIATRQDRGAVRRTECACFGWERYLFGLWPRTGKQGTEGWIASIDDQPAGYLLAYPHALDDAFVMYVGGVGVLSEYRGLGIGSALMRAVLADHPTLWLHVRSRNAPAISMYKKLGLCELHHLPHFYTNGDGAVVMGTVDLFHGGEVV